MNKKLYHISHTDLDGFGSQFISSHYFEDVVYLNTDYGYEISARIEEVKQSIIENDEWGVHLFITDVNLDRYSIEKAKEILALNRNIKLQLLDHHISGEKYAKDVDWYYLDTKRCATKITHDYFKEHFEPHKDISKLALFADIVNSIDIWLEDSEYFEIGKIFAKATNEANELSRFIFQEANVEYKFFIYNKMLENIEGDDSHIRIEEEMIFYKKEFLNSTKRETLDNLIVEKQLELIDEKIDDLTIEYGEHKGLLTFNLYAISNLANSFLRKETSYHFFINVSSKGFCSIRANNAMDVAAFAEKYLNGGGHKNASGGRISDFKETFLYRDVKNQILNLISD